MLFVTVVGGQLRRSNLSPYRTPFLVHHFEGENNKWYRNLCEILLFWSFTRHTHGVTVAALSALSACFLRFHLHFYGDFISFLLHSRFCPSSNRGIRNILAVSTRTTPPNPHRQPIRSAHQALPISLDEFRKRVSFDNLEHDPNVPGSSAH